MGIEDRKPANDNVSEAERRALNLERRKGNLEVLSDYVAQIRAWIEQHRRELYSPNTMAFDQDRDLKFATLASLEDVLTQADHAADLAEGDPNSREAFEAARGSFARLSSVFEEAIQVFAER